MTNQPANTNRFRDRKKFLWGAAGAALFLVVVILVVTTSNRPLSPEEIAMRWVDDNVDAMGEEIAALLTDQNPVLREVGGELLEDSIHAVIE